MSGIGHNKGPTMDKGRGWRRYAWTRARADLLPKLPIEVVRLRVKRARELGLDYKAYASIRAASGHDVVALLFSSNALRALDASARIDPMRKCVVEAIRGAERLALVHPPIDPIRFLDIHDVFEAAARAPGLRETWAEMRARVSALTTDRGIPGDRVVLIGDTTLEREWCAAGKLAGYVASDAYFSGPA